MRRWTYNARGNLFDSGNRRVWIDQAASDFFSHRPVNFRLRVLRPVTGTPGHRAENAYSDSPGVRRPASWNM